MSEALHEEEALGKAYDLRLLARLWRFVRPYHAPALGALLALSIAAFTVGATSMTVADFGFNFDPIVNTNNASQGSLRQFILNSNALGVANLDQDDTLKTLPAGLEHSIFGIPITDPNYNISGNGEDAVLQSGR